MSKLKKIFNIIEKENIILEDIEFVYDASKGIYFKVPNLPPTIGIHKSILSYSYLYTSVIAEELGHHFTTYGDLTCYETNYLDNVIKNKKESIAKFWAADFLISDDEFEQALHNSISTIEDMCEYFNVTKEILDYKILSIILNEKKYSAIKNSFKLHEVPYETCNI